VADRRGRNADEPCETRRRESPCAALGVLIRVCQPRYEFALDGGCEVAARTWHQRHQRQRWCPCPHHTARRTDLDPPTRLAEGKPSRKNRPPFRGRKRTTATILPLPPPLPPPPPPPSAASRAFLSSSGPPPLARYYRHRQRHRHCSRRLLLRHPRSTVISRNVGTTTATYKPRSRRSATDGRGYVRDRMTRGNDLFR